MNPISETVTMQKRTNEATSGMTQRKTPSTVAAQREAVATADIDYVVGIDIGAADLLLALADMSGTIAAKWSSTTAGVRGAEAVIELIRAGTDNLMQQVSAPAHALKAVAAGAPGITDVDAGIVIATSYLMGWRDVPLRTLLEARLGVPAAVENDVNTAALAEHQIGAAQGVRDFVFIAVGTGIGAGIVLNGRLFHGMDWSAGG